jgi:hypothetical protein
MRVAAAILLLAFSVSAQQAHHIDFTKELVGFDGKPLLDPIDPVNPGKKPDQMTLGEVSINALETGLTEDRDMTGEKKIELDNLARKIYKNKDCVLTAEETTLLKQRIGRLYGPLVVGVAWRLIDPAIEDKK